MEILEIYVELGPAGSLNYVDLQEVQKLKWTIDRLLALDVHVPI